LNNLGISLARAPFCARDLRRGRLVKPFDISTPEHRRWYFATKKETAPKPKLDEFIDWLFELFTGFLKRSRLTQICGASKPDLVTLGSHWSLRNGQITCYQIQ